MAHHMNGAAARRPKLAQIDLFADGADDLPLFSGTPQLVDGERYEAPAITHRQEQIEGTGTDWEAVRRRLHERPRRRRGWS